MLGEQAPRLACPWTPHIEDLKELCFVQKIVGLHSMMENSFTIKLEPSRAFNKMPYLNVTTNHAVFTDVNIYCTT